MSSPEIQFRPYMPGDESKILQLFEQSYKRSLSLNFWKWRFAQNPAGAGMIQLAWDGDTLAAHYAITQIELCVDGQTVKSGLSGTTMTHPNYRGKGLFPKLAELTYRQMEQNGLLLVWGFPNSMSHRVFVTDLAWRDIYEVPFFRAQVVDIQKLPNPHSVLSLDSFDARFDELWATQKHQHRVIGRRDYHQLKWRFTDNPTENYQLLASISGGELYGYLVYKRYQEELQIVDMLSRDVDSALELIAQVVKLAQETNAGSVALWLPLNHELHRALEKCGFLPAAPITYFGARVFSSGQAVDVTYDYHSWFMTMGDSDVY